MSASKKRKTNDRVEDEIDRDEAQRLKEHCAITAILEYKKMWDIDRLICKRVVSGSEIVVIFVGEKEEKRPFFVHKDLIALHSRYFRDHFHSSPLSPPDSEEEKKTILPQYKASISADFNSWLYSGDFLHVGSALNHVTLFQDRWRLGSYLRAPNFQNLCMEAILEEYEQEPTHWMFADHVEYVYKSTAKNSLHRKLTAHVMYCNNPFRKLETGSKALREWDALFEKFPELGSDVTKAGVIQWNKLQPWDHPHRESYMEKEMDLDEAWEKQIVSRRQKAEIKEAAKTGCVKSIIELAHLERRT